MSLPVVSAREAVRAFSRAGFVWVRQAGSHIVLQKKVGHSTVTLVIPNHHELAKGTLRATIRKSGMTVDDFVILLRS